MNEKGLKILVAEDNLVDHMYYCRMANKETYDLTFVYTVRGLREFLKQDIFDVIICNYILEDGTVFDILEHNEITPIIIATLPGEEEFASRAMKKGAANYIIKDLDRNYFKILPDVICKGLETFKGSSTNNNITNANMQEILLKREIEKAYEETKKQLLENISHEIRTPINGIFGMTQILLETKLDSEQNEYANMLRQSVIGLIKIVDDILDFSDIENGKRQNKKEEFNIHMVVNKTIQSHLTEARKKGIQLSVEIDPEVPQEIRSDRNSITQVLKNLIGNAIKFTHMGNVYVTVEKHNDDHIKFSVIDTGIGISKEISDIIFGGFRQGDNTLTRKYSGLGLGLSVSEKLIEKLDGSIWLESKEGKGSAFYFTVPYKKAEECM